MVAKFTADYFSKDGIYESELVERPLVHSTH